MRRWPLQSLLLRQRSDNDDDVAASAFACNACCHRCYTLLPPRITAARTHTLTHTRTHSAPAHFQNKDTLVFRDEPQHRETQLLAPKHFLPFFPTLFLSLLRPFPRFQVESRTIHTKYPTSVKHIGTNYHDVTMETFFNGKEKNNSGTSYSMESL